MNDSQKLAIYNDRRLKQRTTDELIGISKGIIADNHLHEFEIDFLCSWLEKNRHLSTHFPYDILMTRIEIMLGDGKIDDEENKELLQLLKELVGHENLEEENKNFSTTLPLTRPCPEIIFQDMNFCFTGKFYYGSRNLCVEHTKSYGANVINHINSSLDYLVIGGIGSEDWLHSSFGTKIIKVQEINKKNNNIAIISEKDWEQALLIGV